MTDYENGFTSSWSYCQDKTMHDGWIVYHREDESRFFTMDNCEQAVELTILLTKLEMAEEIINANIDIILEGDSELIDRFLEMPQYGEEE